MKLQKLCNSMMLLYSIFIFFFLINIPKTYATKIEDAIENPSDAVTESSLRNSQKYKDLKDFNENRDVYRDPLNGFHECQNTRNPLFIDSEINKIFKMGSDQVNPYKFLFLKINNFLNPEKLLLSAPF